MSVLQPCHAWSNGEKKKITIIQLFWPPPATILQALAGVIWTWARQTEKGGVPPSALLPDTGPPLWRSGLVTSSVTTSIHKRWTAGSSVHTSQSYTMCPGDNPSLTSQPSQSALQQFGKSGQLFLYFIQAQLPDFRLTTMDLYPDSCNVHGTPNSSRPFTYLYKN